MLTVIVELRPSVMVGRFKSLWIISINLNKSFICILFFIGGTRPIAARKSWTTSGGKSWQSIFGCSFKHSKPEVNKLARLLFAPTLTLMGGLVEWGARFFACQAFLLHFYPLFLIFYLLLFLPQKITYSWEGDCGGEISEKPMNLQEIEISHPPTLQCTSPFSNQIQVVPHHAAPNPLTTS